MDDGSVQSRSSDDRTLTGAMRIFVGQLPAQILIGAFLTAALTRAFFGAPGWADAVTVAVLALIHPFVEWILHVMVLHARPRRFLGRRLDSRWARNHRAHHRDPWDLRWVFMPMPHSAIALGLQLALFWVVLPSVAATATLFVTGVALLYEWTHFLIHSHYKPRGRLYRRLWRYHRLHHFKNEHYWFGVTAHLADRLLGTLPDRGKVATSETCRDLGIGESLSPET